MLPRINFSLRNLFVVVTLAAYAFALYGRAKTGLVDTILIPLSILCAADAWNCLARQQRLFPSQARTVFRYFPRFLTPLILSLVLLPHQIGVWFGSWQRLDEAKIAEWYSLKSFTRDLFLLGLIGLAIYVGTFFANKQNARPRTWLNIGIEAIAVSALLFLLLLDRTLVAQLVAIAVQAIEFAQHGFDPLPKAYAEADVTGHWKLVFWGCLPSALLAIASWVCLHRLLIPAQSRRPLLWMILAASMVVNLITTAWLFTAALPRISPIWIEPSVRVQYPLLIAILGILGAWVIADIMLRKRPIEAVPLNSGLAFATWQHTWLWNVALIAACLAAFDSLYKDIGDWFAGDLQRRITFVMSFFTQGAENQLILTLMLLALARCLSWRRSRSTVSPEPNFSLSDIVTFSSAIFFSLILSLPPLTWLCISLLPSGILN